LFYVHTNVYKGQQGKSAYVKIQLPLNKTMSVMPSTQLGILMF